MARIDPFVLLLLAGCATTVHPPSLATSGGYHGHFNNDDQGHADFCVRLTVDSALLRYPDGAPGRSRLGELHRQLEAALRRASTS